MTPYWIGKQNSLLDGLQWTADEPTRQGWYWAQTDAGIPTIVKVGLFGTGKSNTLWVYMTGNDKAHHFDIFDFWLGPLPVPEPPEGL